MSKSYPTLQILFNFNPLVAYMALNPFGSKGLFARAKNFMVLVK